MSTGEKWTVFLGIPSLLLLALSVYIQIAEREEHKAGTMSTIGIVVFYVLVAAVAIWAIYRNISDAHRSKDLSAQIISIKDENDLQVRALDDRLKEKEAEIESLKRKQPSFMVLNNGFPVAGIGPESETEDISRDDPRMAIEVQTGKEKGLSPTTSIKVRNVGNSELQNLRFQTTTVAGAVVRFDDNIPPISPQSASECIYPIVDGVGPMQRHNLAGQMMKDWEHQGGLKVEKLIFPGKAMYEDYGGTKYIAELAYEFFPHKFRSRQNHDDKSVIPDTGGPYLVVKTLRTQNFKKA